MARRRGYGKNRRVKGHSRSPRGPNRGKGRVPVRGYRRRNPWIKRKGG